MIVGAEENTNIYDHVCQKLLQIPLKNNKEETERDIFLQKLTSSYTSFLSNGYDRSIGRK